VANLILPSRFNQQPQGAVDVDNSNPLTHRLQLVNIPSGGTTNLIEVQAGAIYFLGETGKVQLIQDGLGYGGSLNAYGRLTRTNTNTASAHTIFTYGTTSDNNSYPVCGFRNSENNPPNSVYVAAGGAP
jgi:hypothetical protein